MTTEIYSCKEGQALKEGKLEYSSTIDHKDDAAPDALRRCQRDPSIKKIAYYRVSPDGEFRVFYSYTNPNCKPAAPPKMAAGPAKKRTVRKPPPKLGFFAKVIKALGM